MKIILTTAILLVLSATAYAQSPTATSTSGSSSNSSSNVNASQGNMQGTSVNITSNSNSAPIPAAQSMRYSGIDRGAPTVVVGGYSSSFSPDSCMSTAQAGVSGPGFGISAGKGIPDKNCQLLRRVDAHGRLAQAYGVQTPRGQYQLQQAAIDACLADGYDRDGCVKANTETPVGNH